jgi:hypothetical protein
VQTVARKNGAQQIAARFSVQTVYPRRSPSRCGFAIVLDIARSISQKTQTKAVPRPTTTPRNTNVKAGAVSMFSIPDAMQAAYQQTKRGLGDKTPGPQ